MLVLLQGTGGTPGCHSRDGLGCKDLHSEIWGRGRKFSRRKSKLALEPTPSDHQKGEQLMINPKSALVSLLEHKMRPGG